MSPQTEAPRVYSYTRFSTPEQAAGHSSQRQMDMVRQFAAEHGLELDENLRINDEGVSAYRGAHLSPEAGLGQFIMAVDQGFVPANSILVLENLDRFSRMEPLDTQHILTGVLRKGIRIATLTDRRIYSRESLREDNGLGLMIALMDGIRAHNESREKGRRVAAAWAEKRKRVRAGTDAKLTRRSPPWLRWTGSEWEVDETKAGTVRRIYRLTLEGRGEHKIAELLTREGIAPIGRARMWHRSSVAKLLRSPTVIGTLTPGRMEFDGAAKRRVLEEPIPNAYPAIVSEEEWHSVRAIKDGRTATVRGRGARAALSNIFAGLARCPSCGSAMTRVTKGSRKKAGRPKLVCTRARVGGGCTYRTVPLDAVEEAFADNWQSLFADVPAGERHSELDRTHAELTGALGAEEDRLEALADELELNPSRTLAARLRSVEAHVEALRTELDAVEERRAMVDGGLIRARLESLRGPMGAEQMDKAAVNATLRSLFDGVEVDYCGGYLNFRWKQGGESSIVYAWPEEEADAAE